MQEQITNEPEPGCCVTVMRPGTALCSPCTFLHLLPSLSFFLLLSPGLPPLSPLSSVSPSSHHHCFPNLSMDKFSLLLLSLCFSSYSDLFFLSFGGRPAPVHIHLPLLPPCLCPSKSFFFTLPVLSYSQLAKLELSSIYIHTTFVQHLSSSLLVSSPPLCFAPLLSPP